MVFIFFFNSNTFNGPRFCRKSAGRIGFNGNYYDNFNAATKNNSETVFAQMSVNDGSASAQNSGLGVSNSNYGDVRNFPYNGGPTGCCGFFNPSESLGNAYKTDVNGLPLLDTYNQGSAVSDRVSPYTGTLDPRIVTSAYLAPPDVLPLVMS